TETTYLKGWAKQSYSKEDGSAILQFVKLINLNCSQPQLYLRILHPNGTITPLNFDFSLFSSQSTPNIQDFNFCLTPYGGTFVDVVALKKDYLLISYLDLFNGGMYQRNVLFLRNINLSPSHNSHIKNVIAINNDPDKGFLSLSAFVDTNNLLLWSIFDYGEKENHGIRQISNGTFGEPGMTIATYNAFSTLDGNYAIAYTLDKSTNTTQSAYPQWQAEVTFLRRSTTSNDSYQLSEKPFVIFPYFNQLKLMEITSCHILYDGIGHSCFIILHQIDPATTPTTGQQIIIKSYLRVSFLLNGINVDVKYFTKLNYGNYLVSTTIAADSRNVNLYIMNLNSNSSDNHGVVDENLQKLKDLENDVSVTDIYDVFPNNTCWFLTSMGAKNNWSIGLVDLPKSLSKGEFLDPQIDSIIPMQLSNLIIGFDQNITLSNNNISIYQISDSSSSSPSSSTTTSIKIDDPSSSSNYLILKQSVIGKSSYCRVGEDGKSVIVKVLGSTFNIAGANYMVVVDNGFVNNQESNEPIAGIKKDIWSFKTESTIGLLRLTEDGTNYFGSLSDTEKSLFVAQLQVDFTTILSVESDRISNYSKFQQDPNIFHSGKNLLILSFDLHSTQNYSLLNVDTIASNLDTLIKNKWVTAISNSKYGYYLDDEYGFKTADGDESGVYDVPNNQNRKSLSRSSLIIGRSEALSGGPQTILGVKYPFNWKILTKNVSWKATSFRKGFDWSFSEAVRSKISNTVPSIEKHLISCDNFKVVYPNRIEFVNIQLEIIKNKRNIGRTSQANGDVEDDTTIFNNNSQNEVIPIHSNTPTSVSEISEIIESPEINGTFEIVKPNNDDSESPSNLPANNKPQPLPNYHNK
ncbi:6709_t:CDS:10, partial [Entrophospora sp. SA101]